MAAFSPFLSSFFSDFELHSFEVFATLLDACSGPMAHRRGQFGSGVGIAVRRLRRGGSHGVHSGSLVHRRRKFGSHGTRGGNRGPKAQADRLARGSQRLHDPPAGWLA